LGIREVLVLMADTPLFIMDVVPVTQRTVVRIDVDVEFASRSTSTLTINWGSYYFFKTIAVALHELSLLVNFGSHLLVVILLLTGHKYSVCKLACATHQ